MNLLSNPLAMEIFGGIIVVLFGFYLYFKLVLYNYWRKKNVVYVEPTVPFGNILEYIRGKTHIVDVFANAYSKLKKNRYFGMYSFYKPVLVIADLDLLREVMSKEFSHFHDRGLYCNEEIDPITGHLFFLSGQKWRNINKKLSPTFTAAKMKNMFGAVKDKGDLLVEILEKRAQNQEVVEIKDIMARYTTDVIITSAFGVNCDSLNDPYCDFRHWGKKVFEIGSVKGTFVMLAPQIMDYFKIPYIEKGISEFFIKIFKEAVDYRVANNIRRDDFMDLLLQLIKTGRIEEDGEDTAHISESIDGKMSLMEATAQAFIFYCAGYETSSTTVSHCLYELSIHQEMQDKVRNEIESVLEEHGDITQTSVNDMTYLHKCVSETLRKHPPLGILHRVCTKDIDLPNTKLHVDKGVDVVIPVLGIHMDPEIYPDPMKFDPERFTKEKIAARHQFAYLPFGKGPRICIGMSFGYLEVKVALISVLRKFRFTLGPDTREPLQIDPEGNFIYTAKEINLRIESLN